LRAWQDTGGWHLPTNLDGDSTADILLRRAYRVVHRLAAGHRRHPGESDTGDPGLEVQLNLTAEDKAVFPAAAKAATAAQRKRINDDEARGSRQHSRDPGKQK